MAAKIIKITRFVFFKTIFVKSLSIFVNSKDISGSWDMLLLTTTFFSQKYALYEGYKNN